MQNLGDKTDAGAATTGGLTDDTARGRREPLFGPGVPTAESFVDDGFEAELSYENDGPSMEPAFGSIGQPTSDESWSRPSR